MTRRLRWYRSDSGPTPDCHVCLEWMLSPLWVEAVASVAIGHGDPTDSNRRALDVFHANNHEEATDG